MAYTVIEPKTIHVFRGTYYLIGETDDGTRYYLEKPTFDCGWYWGGLYIETFTNNRCPEKSRDIQSHQHMDSLFLKSQLFGDFRNMFKKCVLNDTQIWRLLELSRTFYTLRSYADLVHIGGSYITTNTCYDTIKSDEEHKRVCTQLIPAVISEICNLLGGNTTPEEFAKQVK